MQLYAAYPRHDARPEVPMQYADFAAWQSDVLADENGEAGRAYWRAQDLRCRGGAQPAWDDHPAADNASDLPQSVTVTIAADAMARIAALAQQYGTSVAVCLLACWQTLAVATHRAVRHLRWLCRVMAESMRSCRGPWDSLPGRCPSGDILRTNVQFSDTGAASYTRPCAMLSAWLEYYPGYAQSRDRAGGWVSVMSNVWRGVTAVRVSFAVQQHYSRSERFHLHLACERTERNAAGRSCTTIQHCFRPRI